MFGALCGAIILGEPIGVTDLLGGLLILAGLACVVYQRYRDSLIPVPSTKDTDEVDTDVAAPADPLAPDSILEPSTSPSSSASDTDSKAIELESIEPIQTKA